ncbi:MAG: ABC transporter substrate-binding protein [Rhodospirillales bacterium]|nr:ABC transporter substrate-binding protein [Rhodospirillales bacterium]
MRIRRRALLAASAAALLLPRAARAQSTRTVTDMAGRKVALPAKIARVVTLGSLPVINSFVFAMGEGRTLLNGLADFDRPHWKYQTVFAPHLKGLPRMQQPNREPNVEAILLARPDVVLTMHRESVGLLESRGIAVVFLAWREPEDAKACMAILGEVFGKPEVARRYTAYFDGTLHQVRATLAGVTEKERPRVLYMQPGTLTQPRLIAEWWIPAAGGVSVTNDGRTAESRSFTLEQVIAWDPDILIVTDPRDVTLVQTDRVFRELRAVKSGKVYIVPIGAHTWANRTSEQPLTVLWAAKTFHPARFPSLDLAAETDRFYREFFGHALAKPEIDEILSGAL